MLACSLRRQAQLQSWYSASGVNVILGCGYGSAVGNGIMMERDGFFF